MKYQSSVPVVKLTMDWNRLPALSGNSRVRTMKTTDASADTMKTRLWISKPTQLPLDIILANDVIRLHLAVRGVR